jgi:hypothetical protein
MRVILLRMLKSNAQTELILIWGVWSQGFRIIYANFYCCSINNY